MKIYLATPYTGNEEASFKNANRVAGDLMNKGHIVFSPISHTHPIACECNLPKGWDFWNQFDTAFIEWCDELWVVCNFVDYKQSKGVMAEIEISRSFNKPVRWIQFYGRRTLLEEP